MTTRMPMNEMLPIGLISYNLEFFANWKKIPQPFQPHKRWYKMGWVYVYPCILVTNGTYAGPMWTYEEDDDIDSDDDDVMQYRSYSYYCIWYSADSQYTSHDKDDMMHH